MTNEFWGCLSIGKNFYRSCFEGVRGKYGLSHIELDVIIFLNATGECRAVDIVKNRGLTKSNVSVAISNLIKLGIVSEHKKEGNKKSIYLSLTKKADEILLAINSANQQFVTILLNGFSENEIANMREIFTRLLNNIKGANV